METVQTSEPGFLTARLLSLLGDSAFFSSARDTLGKTLTVIGKFLANQAVGAVLSRNLRVRRVARL